MTSSLFGCRYLDALRRVWQPLFVLDQTLKRPLRQAAAFHGSLDRVQETATDQAAGEADHQPIRREQQQRNSVRAINPSLGDEMGVVRRAVRRGIRAPAWHC